MITGKQILVKKNNLKKLEEQTESLLVIPFDRMVASVKLTLRVFF